MHANKKVKRISRQSASAADHVTSNDTSGTGYQIDLMPVDKIVRRTLFPYSVHYSLPSSCWIATISRYSESYSELNKMRYSQFEFASEKEGKVFCKSYSPPKMLQPTEKCFICSEIYTAKVRPCYCRNCGVACCQECMVRWSSRMIPKTYVHPAYHAQTVRVCKSCDWLSNAFCLALLQGRFQDAVKIVESGNVNLRSCFADIRGESMFPVHCCTLGGNLELLKFLVDGQKCPLSIKRDPKGKMLSIKTSNDRTLIDLAMVGKPKLDVLVYLIRKGLTISDLADPSLTARTLEALLKSDLLPGGVQSTVMTKALAVVDPSEGSIATNATIDSSCNLCCEKAMDCVLSPCGHQLCCIDCGNQLEICPLCKVKITPLKIIPC